MSVMRPSIQSMHSLSFLVVRPLEIWTLAGVGKAGSEAVGLQESLTIGKKSLIEVWRFLRRKER